MSRRLPRGLEMRPASVETKALLGAGDGDAAILLSDPEYVIESYELSTRESHKRVAELRGKGKTEIGREPIVLATAHHGTRTMCDVLGIRGWPDGTNRHSTGFAVCGQSRGTIEGVSACLIVSERAGLAGEYEVVVLRAGDRMPLPDGTFSILGLDPHTPAAVFHLPTDIDDYLRLDDKMPPLLIDAELSSAGIRLLKMMDGKYQPILAASGLADALIVELGDTVTITRLAGYGVHVIDNHHHHDAVDTPSGKRVLISRSMGDWSDPTRRSHGGEGITSRFLERWERLQREKAALIATLQPTRDRTVTIVIEGPGKWVKETYQPSLRSLKKDHELDLLVTYVHTGKTDLAKLEHWERELNKDTHREKYDRLVADFVFVATPDHTHCEIAKSWLETRRRRAALIFIEKPFDSDPDRVQELIRAHAAVPDCNILGLDHYLMYERPLLDKLPDVIRELGGAVTNVDFYLCETDADLNRLGTLQFGMTLDLLPHLLALLEKYTDLETLDDIVVDERSCYAGVEFDNETYSRTQFTAGWAGEDTARFDCRAAVGKGLQEEVKYMELRGVNSKVLRIDFKGEFPRGSIFIHAKGAPQSQWTDPHHPERKLHIIAPSVLGQEGWLATAPSKDRYVPLLKGLVDGHAEEAVKSTLLMADAAHLVSFLDRLRTFMSGESCTVMTEYTIREKSVSEFLEVDS